MSKTYVPSPTKGAVSESIWYGSFSQVQQKFDRVCRNFVVLNFGSTHGVPTESDLTFFKNLPSNSLPTGKSFQSIATKFPYPGLHIAVHPKAGPEKGTIKISPNKSLQSLFINAAASPKTLTSSRQVGSQIHPHVGRRKIQISPPRGEQDWSNALPQGQQKQSNPPPCPAPPPPAGSWSLLCVLWN